MATLINFQTKQTVTKDANQDAPKVEQIAGTSWIERINSWELKERKRYLVAPAEELAEVGERVQTALYCKRRAGELLAQIALQLAEELSAQEEEEVADWILHNAKLAKGKTQ